MSELPSYLNQFQAVAWVMYRARDAVDKLNTWRALAAENINGNTPRLAKKSDLLRALQAGRIAAHGSEDGVRFREIPAIEWQVLRLAPLDWTRHFPYKDIRLCGRDLQQLWPAQKVRMGLFDWERCSKWFDELVAAEPAININQAARELRVMFGPNPPSETTIKTYVRRWRIEKGLDA